MIKVITIINVITVIATGGIAQAAVMSSSSYKIQIDSVNAGGTRASSASYALEQTSGEAGTGRLTGTSNNLWAGFQLPVVATPGPTSSAAPGASKAGTRRAEGTLLNVQSFTATPGDNQARLRWENPHDIDVAGVRIMRSGDFYPADPSDGILIYSGADEEFLDTGLQNGKPYYYTAFAYDQFGNFASGAVAFATPFAPGVSPLREPGEPTPPIEPPMVPPELIPPSIRDLSLLDFDFIQNGTGIPTRNGRVTIEQGKPFTIAIDYDRLPEVLKTILVSMENEKGEQFSFLLRADEEKQWYVATLNPPVLGMYGLKFFVVDYANQGLQSLPGQLEVKEAFAGSAAPPAEDGLSRLFPELLLFLLIAFLILALWFLAKRYIGFRSRAAARYIGCLLLALFLVSFTFQGTADAAFNTQINYQGKLTDTSDNAVADGDYNFKFQLCTDSACATSVWSETRETTNKVTVTNGIFSVLLGSVTSIASVDFNQSLWLEVQVGGTGSSPSYETLTPRKKLGAVPAAFEADKLDGLDSTAFALVSNNLSDLAATSTAIGNLGLTIGTDVQAYDDELRDMASTTPTKGDLIVSDGTDWLDLVVGSDGLVLMASSTASNGLSWETVAGATALDEIGDPTASSTIEIKDTILTIDSSAASSTLVLDGNLGRIGIRTLSPSSTLDVTGSIRATDAFLFSDGSTQAYGATPNGFSGGVTTATFKQAFSISGQETTPEALFFKPDGKKMYVMGSSGTNVNEYDLSTAWDVSTATFLQLFSVLTQEADPQGLFFKPDGTKMYVMGKGGDDVNEYDLSTAWDVSTATFLQLFSVATQETIPQGLFFRPDGKKMYVIGNSGDDVNEYDLSTAWDVSTATFLQLFSVLTQEANPTDVVFKPDGKKMYVLGIDGIEVNEYNLSTPWDVSTAAFVQLFSVANEETAPSGLFFKPDSTKMYVLGSTGDDVNEYDLGLVLEGAARFNGPLALGSQTTMTANAATSSVTAGSHFVTANTASTTVSNFTDGIAGQLILIETGDANTTYDCTSNANFNCGTTDIVAETGNILTWIYDGTVWNLINWMNTKAAQSGADIAEFFPSQQELKPGDLVAVDATRPVTVRKTNQPHDKQMIGIISTDPGITLGERKEGSYAVALAGRVPVNVSLENGPIRVGDLITSSREEGIGMKAVGMGRTIGYALEPFGLEKSETGTILVFIDPSWSFGSFREDGVLAGVEGGEEDQPQETGFVALIKRAIESFTGTVKTAGNWIFDKITASIVRVEKIELEDQKTGQVYCTWIENGEWIKAAGECTDENPKSKDQIPNNNSSSNPPPPPAPPPAPSPAPEEDTKEPAQNPPEADNEAGPPQSGEASLGGEPAEEEPIEEELVEEPIQEEPVEEEVQEEVVGEVIEEEPELEPEPEQPKEQETPPPTPPPPPTPEPAPAPAPSEEE